MQWQNPGNGMEWTSYFQWSSCGFIKFPHFAQRVLTQTQGWKSYSGKDLGSAALPAWAQRCERKTGSKATGRRSFPPSEEVKAPKTLCSPWVPAICTSPIHEKRGITRLHRRCHPWKCLLTRDGPMSSITEAWAAFWPSQSQPVSKQPQLIRKAMRASVLESYTELFVVSCTLWRPHLLSKKSRLS